MALIKAGSRAVAFALGVFFVQAAAGAQFPGSISVPSPINNDAASDTGADLFPSIASDGMGHWVAAWQRAGSIYVAQSADNGSTWTAPLNALGVNPGSLGAPRVVSNRAGTWLIIYSAASTDFYDILVIRSSDNGSSWSTPVTVNSNAATNNEDNIEPALAAAGPGNWVATWTSNEDLNGTGGDFEVFYATSSNGGANWSLMQPLNTNATSDSGVDHQPFIASDGAGNCVAVWTSYDSLGGTIGTDADILVARSANYGSGWTSPAQLNSDAQMDNQGDHVARVATDGSGNWVAIWFNTFAGEGAIFSARSLDGGGTWTARHLVSADAAYFDTFADDYVPGLATNGMGDWIAVWVTLLQPQSQGDADIMVSHSGDAGITWSTALELNTDAATDANDRDRRLGIASDGYKNWIVAWDHDDNPPDELGGDDDILMTRLVLQPQVPTISGWGSIVLLFSLLIAASLILRRASLNPAIASCP
jgi:hypothetical protein